MRPPGRYVAPAAGPSCPPQFTSSIETQPGLRPSHSQQESNEPRHKKHDGDDPEDVKRETGSSKNERKQ
jgi:hypothetical protein